jgi:hypothetical protein
MLVVYITHPQLLMILDAGKIEWGRTAVMSSSIMDWVRPNASPTRSTGLPASTASWRYPAVPRSDISISMYTGNADMRITGIGRHFYSLVAVQFWPGSLRWGNQISGRYTGFIQMISAPGPARYHVDPTWYQPDIVWAFGLDFTGEANSRVWTRMKI